MSEFGIEVFVTVSAAVISVVGAMTPIVSKIIDSISTANNKRMDTYIEHKHSAYSRFVSAYSELSVYQDKEHYAQFISAAHLVMLNADDKSIGLIWALLLSLEASGGIINTDINDAFHKCMTSLRDESAEYRKYSNPKKHHRVENPNED